MARHNQHVGKMSLYLILGLVAVIAATLTLGAARWQSASQALDARLEAAYAPAKPTTYDANELDGLPAPVQRYFRAVLSDGQAIVSRVSVTHTGTFNMSETAEQWKPFTSTQHVTTRPPGFVWNGRIAMIPGLPVRVHDAYVAGEGLLRASLFGLITLAEMRGTPAMNEGELMRYLAEAAWYPTALLPGQGVQWTAVDDSSAKATLRDGNTRASLLFRFDEAGLIESVYAETRGRSVAGDIIATPWEGRWFDYALRDGMRIPLAGEVAWLLPEGRKPYWRGRIAEIRFE